MGRIILSHKAKDRVLDVILLISVLLFITGFVRPKPNNHTDTPVNSEYSVLRLEPLSIGELTQFEEVKPIEESTAMTMPAVQTPVTTPDSSVTIPKNQSSAIVTLPKVQSAKPNTNTVTNTLNKTLNSVKLKLF